MKLSANSFSLLLFLAAAITIFVLMTLRPAVEGNAINFGGSPTIQEVSEDTSTSSTSISTAVDSTIDAVTETTKKVVESATTAVNTVTETVTEPVKTIVEVTKDMIKDDMNAETVKMAPLKKSE